MPAMTNLLVKDDASTIKEWTLIPITDSPFPQWRANDPALPIIAQPRLSCDIQPTKTGMKITAKLEVPVLETLGASGTALGYVAAPKVAHTVTVINTMFADERATNGDRANAHKMMTGLLQGASDITNTGALTQLTVANGFKNSVFQLIQLFISAVKPS